MARINTALTFEFAFSSNGVAADGLTVTADIRNPAGTEVVTDGSCTAIGDGRYRYSMSSALNVALGNYSALGKCSDTALDQQHIPALIVVEEVDVSAAAVSAIAAAVGAGATDPDECEIYGYIRRNGEWAKDVVVTFQLLDAPVVADGATFWSQPEAVYTGADGKYSYTVPREKEFRVRINDSGVTKDLTAPDQASYNISELVA